MPFQVFWTDASGNEIKGPDNPTGTYMFPVVFPGTSSLATQIQMRTNARDLQSYETVQNVSFYLSGNATDVNTVQNVWPVISSSQSQLNGGFDISFDFGRTYIRFNNTTGVLGDPSSWILLPAEAIGSQGVDGQLGAFDSATMIIRLVIPPSATEYKILNIELGVDFDVI